MGSTSDNNCAFNSQELAILRPSSKPSNWYGFCRLSHGTYKGFVLYQEAYSAYNFICIDIDSNHHPKLFSRIVLIS